MRGCAVLLSYVVIAAALFGCDPSSDRSIPSEIDELSVDVFDGLGGSWDTRTFDLSADPITYEYQHREALQPVCQSVGTLTQSQAAALRDDVSAVRYRQFSTDAVSADQRTRSIGFRRTGTLTTIYWLFDSDWEREVYPAADFFYATAGSESLVALTSNVTDPCTAAAGNP